MSAKKIIFIVFAVSYSLFGETPEFTSGEALTALEKYNNKIKEADKQYFLDLESALKSATKASNLKEANLIQAELERLKIRFLTLEHGKTKTTTVYAHRPTATGIKLKKGQKFILKPNLEDRWCGGGSKEGILCDYMGYGAENVWMRMNYHVGTEDGTPVEAGRVQIAKQDGELFLFAGDNRPAGNTGKIRVEIVVSPE